MNSKQKYSNGAPMTSNLKCVYLKSRINQFWLQNTISQFLKKPIYI